MSSTTYLEQESLMYDVPRVIEKTNKFLEGFLDRIESYEFHVHSESVPGCSRDVSRTTTTLHIRKTGEISPTKLEFPAYVGQELVGHTVTFEDKTIETRTLFDPKGRENDSSFRIGKVETVHIQSLTVNNSDKPIPKYVIRQTSQYSL